MIPTLDDLKRLMYQPTHEELTRMVENWSVITEVPDMGLYSDEEHNLTGFNDKKEIK